MSPDNDHPSLIVWEFPFNTVTDSTQSNPLTVLTFRQLLPTMAIETKATQNIEDNLSEKKTIEFNPYREEVGQTALKIELKTDRTRELALKLVYTEGTEELTLKHPRGNTLEKYLVELKKDMGTLKSVTFTDQKLTGKINLSLIRYED